MLVHIEHDEDTDPRVLRTRRLLINSFAKLLIENKSIRKVSVQSVTKEAGVNRVTFYAHFKDKYDLLDVWARLMFKQSVAEKLPKDAILDNDNLKLMIDSTLEFFIYRNKYQRRINERFEPLFEAAIQQELDEILKIMLENTYTNKLSVSIENMATYLSWAIFGSLLSWSRNQKVQAKDTLTSELISLCNTITTQLA
jgi:AcrR family transcriptional regulator